MEPSDVIGSDKLINPRPLEDGLERISTGHEIEERRKVNDRFWRACMHNAWGMRCSSSETGFRDYVVGKGVGEA